MKLLLITIFLGTFIAASTSTAKNVVCYFTSWTIYRTGNGKFEASNVDPNLCTHVMYAFVGLNEDGTVWMLDDWEANGLEEISHLINLKSQNPDLKVLVSMGGWNEGSLKYSTVAADPDLRAVMVQSVMDFIDEYDFDGFDLDWEYPGQRGGNPVNDKKNFVTLLTELKAALSAKGKILGAAVAGGVSSSKISYDIPAISDVLDIINVMTYGYHDAYEEFAGHHAALYESSMDETPEAKELNVLAGITYWLDQGADPSKINLGLATYGVGYQLANSSQTDLYAPIVGPSDPGPYTAQGGIFGYNEICEFHSDWGATFDEEQQVPHEVSGDQWVGYDDLTSIASKVEVVKSLNLGGVMIWSLDTDDFLGICGDGKYPLLNQINNFLNNEK